MRLVLRLVTRLVMRLAVVLAMRLAMRAVGSGHDIWEWLDSYRYSVGWTNCYADVNIANFPSQRSLSRVC